MKQIKAEVDLIKAGVGNPLTSLSRLHITQFHVDQKIHVLTPLQSLL